MKKASYIDEFINLRNKAQSDIDKTPSNIVIKIAMDNKMTFTCHKKVCEVLFMEDIKMMNITSIFKLADLINSL